MVQRKESSWARPRGTMQPARLLLAVLLGGLFLPATALGQRFGGEPGPEQTFLAPDRELQAALSKARTYAEDGEYTVAVRLLQRVLETEEDYFELDNAGNPVSRSFKAEAQRIIGSMPDEGRQAYELNYGATAAKQLAEAVAAGNEGGLEEVSRRFFHTKAGYQATFLLAMLHLDRGQPLAAALCLRRLQESPGAASFEPNLSFLEATAWYWAGVRDRATAALAELKNRNPDARIRVGDRNIPLFASTDTALDWLASAIGPARLESQPIATQWVMHRGNATRTLTSGGGLPLLSHRWAIPISNFERVLTEINNLHERYREQEIVAIPALHPIVVDGTVVVRTAESLVAIDFENGKRIWQVEEDLRDVLSQRSAVAAQFSAFNNANATNAQMLEQRIWNDLAYGMLSSDGETVYALQDLTFVPPSGNRRPQVFLPNGQIAGGDTDVANRLQALDLKRQGALRWEIGGEDTPAEHPLTGAFFLGPPLPLSGMLYCLVELQGEIRLVALDARTGNYLWSQQLAIVEQDILTDSTRRLAGVTPSYADGVLVCPTSSGAVVAVDLTNRSLRWGYRYPRSPRRNMDRNAQLRAQLAGQNLNELQRTGWCDSTATVSEGRVILTPLESDELYCVRLVDGELLWKLDRQDGLYVAGVYDGNVVVVGRSSVKAWKLNATDLAASAWSMELPGGAVPSGRGFQSGGTYYLPLSTAEIVAIDLSTGKITGRVQSRDGTVPGNLVSYRGSIISQSPAAIECFYEIEPLEKSVQQRLVANPQDADALRLRGQIHLDRGQLDAAIADFRASLAAQKDAHAQDLLVDAMLAALRADFVNHRHLLGDLEKLVSTPQQQSEFLRLTAEGLRQMGESQAAFEHYLQLASLNWSDQALEQVAPDHAVRRDRWIQARVNELYQAVSEDERQRMDAAIARYLDEALTAEGATALRRYVRYFGSEAGGDKARLALASRLSAEGDLLEKAALLRELAASEDTTQQAKATLQLAQLFAQAGKAQEAAHYYRDLGKKFADVAIDGKPGKDWLAALAQDDPVVRLLDAPEQSWPVGLVESKVEAKVVANTRTYSINLGEGPNAIEPQVTFHWDQTRQAVVARDGLGRDLWQLAVQELGGARNYYVNPNLIMGKMHGHVLYLSLGHELVAIDTLGLGGSPRILWRENLTESLPGLNGRPSYGIRTRQVRQPWGTRKFFAADAYGRPLGTLGPVTDSYICFQRGKEVLALSPLTGEVLWKRTGLEAGSTIFGDEELIFIAGPSETTAKVFRASDGQQLGTRRIPAADRIMTALGRRLLTWNFSGKTIVKLEDPFKGEDVWRMEFEAGSSGYYIDNQGLAVLQRNGRFVVMRLPDGKLEIDTQLQVDPTLNDMYVMRTPDQYLLLTDSAQHRDATISYVNPIPGGTNNPVVNGPVYAFDRATGKQLWSTPVIGQAVLLDQPSELPVLVFAAHRYRRVGNHGDTRYAVTCLDKRNGRVIFEKEEPGSISDFVVTGSYAENQVHLNLMRYQVTMQLTDKPIPAEDKKPAEAKEDDKNAAKAPTPKQEPAKENTPRPRLPEGGNVIPEPRIERPENQ